MLRRSIATALLVLAVSACSASTEVESESNSEPQSSEPSETATDSPSPTPTPEPDADGDGVADSRDYYPKNDMASEQQAIRVTCDVKGRQDVKIDIDRVGPSFKEAWSTPLPEGKGFFDGVYCESYGPRLTPVSDIEQAFWDADRKPSKYTIPIPYEQCVEHGTKWTTKEWPVGDGQIKEAQRALMLCPRHPDAAAIRSRISDLGALDAERKQGTAFSDGNFRVGSRIKPGTYYTENVENCYWERLNSAGEIIDNNFVSNGLRVEVSIASSDFSFHSEGCGMWRHVG